MRFLKHALIAFVLVSICFLTTSSAVQAVGEFSINASTVYNVSLSGTTNVTHNLVLTNRKPDVYATNYTLSTGSTRITDVWARDGLGFLEPDITTSENSTTISFAFKEKSAGLDQELAFSIGYQDKDIAQQIGRVWEINIPQPDKISEFDQYDVTLIVPESFKQAIQISPAPETQSHNNQVIIFNFTKSELKNRGVTAIFGEKQVFDFDLRFTLKNPSLISKRAQIAIPPDTAYQKLFYDRITPQPEKIDADEDGNWLATFEIDAGQTLEIHAIGKAVLFLEPTSQVPDSASLARYLEQQDPWQTDHQNIKELAQKLKNSRNIYNFVVENLSYNYDRVQAGNTRLGAVAALTYPDQAICMEFTDLFIALARAAGIPARELNGYAYTQNPKLRPLSLKQDILHAWPEYYDRDRQAWIPIDPTWGNTTQGIDYFSRFDLNHFVFVIHGKDPNTPYPAGFYKTSTTEGKDISITPSPNDPVTDESLYIAINLPQNLRSGFVNQGSITVKNQGNASLNNLALEVSTSGFDILTPAKLALPPLLPFGQAEIPIKLSGGNPFSHTQGKIRINVGSQEKYSEIEFQPFYSSRSAIVLPIVLGVGLLAVSLKSGGLLLSLKKFTSTLRGESQ